MNTRLKKIMKITAAGLFVVALAINIGVTLNDPFSTVSKEALADTTGTGDSSGYSASTSNGKNYTEEYPECPKSEWTWKWVEKTTSSGGSYSSGGSLSVSYGGASASVSSNGGSYSSSTNTTEKYWAQVPTHKIKCVETWYWSSCTPSNNCRE